MAVPSDPPANVTPTAFKTWAQNVSDTAQDHDARVAALESGTSPHVQEVSPFQAPLSNVTWSSVAANAAYSNGGFRDSSPSVGSEIVYPLHLAAGTWSWTLIHTTNPDRGIVTLAVSEDNVTFTDKATIDGYAASGAANTITTVTGITIPSSGLTYVRLKMSTKNASSTGYLCRLSGIYLTRTGA